MDQNTPDRLHHYTSLSSLAQILKHKKIRFTKLTCLNDPLEGKTEDFEQAAHFVFCSSWTSNPDDTIPLWKMYTDLAGVRITMPSDMFRTTPIPHTIERTPNISLFPEPWALKLGGSPGSKILKGDIVTAITCLFGPDPVVYSNTEDPFMPKTLRSETFGDIELPIHREMMDVGLHKARHWEFEGEWRFRIIAGPAQPADGLEAGTQKELDFAEKVIPRCDFIDIPLREEALASLHILVGPKADSSADIIIDALCSKYAPGAEVSRSKIRVM